MKKITLISIILSLLACSDNQANDVSEKAEDVKQEAKQMVEDVKQEAQEKVAAISKEGFDESKEKVKQSVDAVASETKKDGMTAVSEYQSGIHYEVLSPAVDSGEEEVVVYEFFGYLCPHCNTFQPYMQNFEAEKADNVKLVRVPVIFQPMWKIYAQAYYTAESMGLLEQTHQAMFDAIHKHRKQFRSIEQIADWYASSFGVDKEKFLSTANSFVIDGQLRQSDKLMQAMGIRSTPTLVVNGKYKPIAKDLGTRSDLMKVVNFLVEKELSAQ